MGERDVLTKEERAHVDAKRRWLKQIGPSSGMDAEELELKLVDRLVAEVERLRARNEALEKVAKAALSKPRTICDRCDDGWNEPLNLALSALNDGSGGET